MLALHNLLLGIKAFFNSPSYGEILEHYIVSKHPKDSSDIDRLTIEWQRDQMRGRIL
jgi:hypothetical protein